MYAGTASLSKELPKSDFKSIKAGDVLIQGGFPGHAVIVLDVAQHTQTGEKVFMIAQSYMPAQSIHVLKNFIQPNLGVWYSVQDCSAREGIFTPQWNFYPKDLKSFE